MKLKKQVIGISLSLIVMMQVSINPFNNSVYAGEVNARRSYYTQLAEVAEKMYQEMYQSNITRVADEETEAVKLPSEKVASIGKSLEIKSKVEETEGTINYQWYKNGVALEGKTNATLVIDEVTSEEEGNYTLKVTTTLGDTTKEAISNACVVTVRGFEIFIESTDQTVDLKKLEPGKEFSINVNMNHFYNIGEGIVTLAGQLEYDKNIIDRLEIVGQNEWELKNNSLNEENLKFVIENDNRITEDSGMLKIKFKVKDSITEATQTTIKVKEVTASGGYGAIGTKDAEVEIGIEIPEPEPEEEKITSDVYLIDDMAKEISKIPAKTTVAEFKKNVTTKQEMVFIDEEGNQLEESSFVGTGMTIKVGKTLEYTLIVTGDVDGDGEITVNDLAKVKLHIIDLEKLTGIYFKSADLDVDQDITINDAAKIKLVLIDLAKEI